jgi:hypothetical protein
MSTKLPVEISQRFDMAQKSWEAEVASLKIIAKQWDATSVISPLPSVIDVSELEKVKESVLELRSRFHESEDIVHTLSSCFHGFQARSGTQVREHEFGRFCLIINRS